MKSFLFRMLPLLALAGTHAMVVAQGAARPPLKLVVPYSAGGTTDYVARLLQKPLSEILNQTVVVENKPGAAGTIGTDLGRRRRRTAIPSCSATRGRTPCAGSAQTPYDPLNDLRPLTTVAFMPLMLLVDAEKGPKTLKDFMQQARKPDAKWNYGSSGIGSLAHITGHEFARAARLDMTHVPYQGGGQVITALIQGDIHGSFVTGLKRRLS